MSSELLWSSLNFPEDRCTSLKFAEFARAHCICFIVLRTLRTFGDLIGELIWRSKNFREVCKHLEKMVNIWDFWKDLRISGKIWYYLECSQKHIPKGFQHSPENIRASHPLGIIKTSHKFSEASLYHVRLIDQNLVLKVAPQDLSQVARDPHSVQHFEDGLLAGAIECILDVYRYCSAIPISSPILFGRLLGIINVFSIRIHRWFHFSISLRLEAPWNVQHPKSQWEMDNKINGSHECPGLHWPYLNMFRVCDTSQDMRINKQV